MWHRTHGTEKHVGGKGAEDDGEGQHREQEPVGFVLPLRRVAQRQLGGGADHEVVALPDRHVPVRAFDLVPDPFEELVERDHEEQEEGDVRHAPDDGDVAATEQRQRQEPRPGRHCPAKPEGQGHGRGDRQQQQNRADGPVDRNVLARGQVARQPREAVQNARVRAEIEQSGLLLRPRTGEYLT